MFYLDICLSLLLRVFTISFILDRRMTPLISFTGTAIVLLPWIIFWGIGPSQVPYSELYYFSRLNGRYHSVAAQDIGYKVIHVRTFVVHNWEDAKLVMCVCKMVIVRH